MQRKLGYATLLAAGAAAAYALRGWGRAKPGTGDRERIGYPPLDRLKPIGEDIWIVDSGPIHAAGLAISVRMTVIRLAGGELLLHSPTRFTDALARQLGELGRVRYMVAPTTAHWTFLPQWQKAFTDAEIWAVPGLAQRPQVRSSGLRVDHELGNGPPQAWAEAIEQGLVHGGRGFVEAWFFHRASRSLIVTDLIQNLEPNKLPPASALAARTVRADCGRTALHVRLVLRLGGERMKGEIERLLQLKPEQVIFAHGSWFETDAAERLRRAFDWIA